MSSTERRYAPVIEDDAELGATLGDGAAAGHDADHGRSSSADESAEVKHTNKPSRSSSSDAHAVVLARDSNAVVSVFYPEQRWIGKLLSTADGGSSALCYVLQAVCVVLGVLQLLTGAAMFAEMAGMLAPNPLLHVSMTLGGIAYFPLALVIGSARKALQPGGALEQLKVGEAMISEQDSTTLWRWRVGLGVLSALWFLFGLCFLALGLLAPPDANGEPMPAAERITNTLGAVIIGVILPVAFSGWWASMFTASCLCRDEVVEVIHNVRSADPNSDEWDEAVAEPGLALIEKMELLSAGWSGGLAGFAAFSWLGALSNFTMAINTPLCEGVDAARGWSPGTMRTIWLVTTAICTTLPFLLALDIAATSTWCDNLMAELNDARINHGPESHLKIQWLETALEKLNNGQGLGFKVAGVVIDKKSMKAWAVKLYGVLVTLVGALLTLSTPPATGGDNECALSSVQTSSIQSAMLERNSSCAYNMTVDSVLGAV